MNDPDRETITPQAPTLSREQMAVVDLLHACYEKGNGTPRVNAGRGRIALLLACLLATSAGLVAFAKTIPPFLTTLICGFLLGSLVTSIRYHYAFERQWPLLETLIDWKLVGRLKREASLSSDQEL